MSRGSLFASESALARVVIEELQRQGYETYQEVALTSGKRADIVAVSGPIVVVVETKLSLSLGLLDQLTAWRGRAHRVIGAVPAGRVGASVRNYLHDYGLGLWSVTPWEGVVETVTPRLWRHADPSLRGALCEAQRSGRYAEAGSRDGGYYTPFRRTVDALTAHVQAHPGVPLREALQHVGHHYGSTRSALQSIPELMRRGVIRGIRAEDRPLRLYPVTTEAVR